jgi:predicted anti-sigma-YlaC factor YlaD
MMNCESARELIDLYFGHDELPDGLQTHLDQCDSCRIYHDELVRMAGGLGSDSDTPFSIEDLDRAAAGVAQRIDRQPTVVPLSTKWLRPLLRVAAVLLVVGLAYSSYRVGVDSNFSADLDTLQNADAEVDELTILLEYEVEDEMDEDLIGILINDYCADASYEATASLLDDISEEELEYLTENFEVGDLL